MTCADKHPSTTRPCACLEARPDIFPARQGVSLPFRNRVLILFIADSFENFSHVPVDSQKVRVGKSLQVLRPTHLPLHDVEQTLRPSIVVAPCARPELS